MPGASRHCDMTVSKTGYAQSVYHAWCVGVCVWSSGKLYTHRQVCQVVTNVMEKSKAGKDGVGVGVWWAVF